MIKRTIFEYKSEFGYCTIFTYIKCKNIDLKFLVCNIHLRAGLMSGEQTRICQINSCIKKINPYGEN
ncbi:MAG: hypothetical protein KGD67_12235, partial [Candidatus Lokiarchaeota archaeon]|nr:hypothetical protein [Candidatus Lokiarchaeota archaeon]